MNADTVVFRNNKGDTNRQHGETTANSPALEAYNGNVPPAGESKAPTFGV
jgi:hypothetical protein